MKASDIEKLINYVQSIDAVIAFKDPSNIAQDDLDAIRQNLKKMRDIAVIDGEWISVEDKKPCNMSVVLCCDADSKQYVCTYHGSGYFMDHGSYDVFNVKWWMSLPKPPKGE